MRSNIAKVIEAFKQGRSATGDSKRTCSTDGRTIWSYGMPIAKRWGSKIVLVPYDEGPTRTTKSQIRAVEQSFPSAMLARRRDLEPTSRLSGVEELEERAKEGDTHAQAVLADAYEEAGELETADFLRSTGSQPQKPKKYVKRRLY